MATTTRSTASRDTAEVVDLRVPGGEIIVKSRERVKVYGEVFTPRHLVDQMLDLVRVELETGEHFVDKTFLEPAAGDGNFLIAILQRKLSAIKGRYPEERWPMESLFALASIYGIELLSDNHQDAQKFMLAEFVDFHEQNGIVCHSRTKLWKAADFLISTNVVNGNTLTSKTVTGEPIIFSWWNRVGDSMTKVQRVPFSFASLRAANSGALDFTTYDTYRPCSIDQVHREMKSYGQSEN